MTNKQAAAILMKAIEPDGISRFFTNKELNDGSWYLYVNITDIEASLDGYFGADELEAIAMWMRNPHDVFEAMNQL
jgi:hypothetical protein